MESCRFGGSFSIQINADGTFDYYEGNLSNYIGVGEWELDGDTLPKLPLGTPSGQSVNQMNMHVDDFHDIFLLLSFFGVNSGYCLLMGFLIREGYR